MRIEIEHSVQPPEDPITIAEYEYNGLNWRTVKRADTDIPVDGLDEQRKFTYSASWQLLEERIDEDYVGDPGLDRGAQYYWGLRYIDDAIVCRVDEDGNGSIDKNYFYLTDALFTPIAIVRANGLLMERLTYDSYGHARHHWPDDLDGDGDVDNDDENLGYDAAGESIGDDDYNVDADINRDGIVNASDLALFNNPTTALPSGFISDPDTVDSPIGFAGYVFNPEALNYTVRHRHYDPVLGRWIERDPAGYVDGRNLYDYVRNTPAAAIDPFGLAVFEGPKAGMISWIADFNPGTQISIFKLLEEYEKATGKTLSWGRATSLLVALDQLALSANDPPAASYTPAQWDVFVEDQEYRGFLYFKPEICCNKQGVVTGHSLVDKGHSFGWTPMRTVRDEPYGQASGGYMEGVGKAGTPTYTNAKVSRTKACVEWTVRSEFRVGTLGQIVARVLTGVGVPWVWEEVKYELCCTGTYTIWYRGSDFPSHKSYLDGIQIHHHHQRQLERILFIGGAAPGGELHRTTGKVKPKS